MAVLELQKNEFTVEGLLAKMVKEYGKKNNGASFTKADIHDWANKHKIPKPYGGQFMKTAKLGPLKILILSKEDFKDYKVESVVIKK